MATWNSIDLQVQAGTFRFYPGGGVTVQETTPASTASRTAPDRVIWPKAYTGWVAEGIALFTTLSNYTSFMNDHWQRTSRTFNDASVSDYGFSTDNLTMYIEEATPVFVNSTLQLVQFKLIQA